MKRVVLLVAIAILCVPAFATRIWGRILNVGGLGGPNVIESVRIVTDRNETYWGTPKFVQGPGLIWERYVPNHTRSYTVYVTVRSDLAWLFLRRTEVAYGFWMWYDYSRRCADVVFIRR